MNVSNQLLVISIPDFKNLLREEITSLLKSYQPQIPKPQKQIFNFADGCKYLGICKSFGYKLTANRKIPHSKRGKRIYFEKSELDNWLVENKVKDRSKIEAEANNYLTKKKR